MRILSYTIDDSVKMYKKTFIHVYKMHVFWENNLMLGIKHLKFLKIIPCLLLRRINWKHSKAYNELAGVLRIHIQGGLDTES